MQKRGGVWKKERAVQLDSSGLPLTILRRVSSSSCFLASVYIVSRPERDVWYTSRSALISCCAACNIKQICSQAGEGKKVDLLEL